MIIQKIEDKKIEKDMKMNSQDEKIIMSTYDYVYIRSNFFNIALGCVGLIYYDSNSIFYSVAAVFVLGFVIISLLRVLFLYKDRDINFYSTKIVNTKEHLTLNHNEIDEIYKVSFFSLLNFHTEIVRFNIIQKIFHIFILIVILWFPYLLAQLLMSIHCRKIVMHEALIFISKNNRRGIIVQIPLSNSVEQKKLEEYIHTYFNIDFTSLKTKFFLPTKG